MAITAMPHTICPSVFAHSCQEHAWQMCTHALDTHPHPHLHKQTLITHVWPLSSLASSFLFPHTFSPSFLLFFLHYFALNNISSFSPLISSLYFCFFVFLLQASNTKHISAAVRVPPSVQMPKQQSVCTAVGQRILKLWVVNQTGCTSNLKYSGGAYKLSV